MRNTGLEEAQAGIRIAGRNINNLRYADDTTLMAESEEQPKSLLMKVKEESDKPVYETAKETLMYRTVLWTLLERERVGRFGRMALKHI